MAFVLLLFGCTTNLTTKEAPLLDAANWMNQVLTNINEDATLRDLCMPQSHDAGTYVLTTCSGGNECNTQTQHLDMTAQLEAGLRIFDIRPAWINGDYYTQHVTNCGGFGCQGDLISNMLFQIKSFVDSHGELVVIKFNNFCDTGHYDSDFVTLIQDNLGDRIYKESSSNSLPLIQQPLKDIISPDSKSGKIVLLFDGVPDNAQKRAEGLFSNSNFPTVSKWSNTKYFNNLKEDQLRWFENYNNDGSRLFELSWTLTQDDTLAVQCVFPQFEPVSIRDLADEANSHLPTVIDSLIDAGAIARGMIPNIISTDFVDQFLIEECYKITVLNNQ